MKVLISAWKEDDDDIRPPGSLWVLSSSEEGLLAPSRIPPPSVFSHPPELCIGEIGHLPLFTVGLLVLGVEQPVLQSQRSLRKMQDKE